MNKREAENANTTTTTTTTTNTHHCFSLIRRTEAFGVHLGVATHPAINLRDHEVVSQT
jgi:hypothetical protein